MGLIHSPFMEDYYAKEAIKRFREIMRIMDKYEKGGEKWNVLSYKLEQIIKQYIQDTRPSPFVFGALG